MTESEGEIDEMKNKEYWKNKQKKTKPREKKTHTAPPPPPTTTTKHKKMIIMRIKLQMYIVAAAAAAATIARRYYDFNLIVMLFVCIIQPWSSLPLRCGCDASKCTLFVASFALSFFSRSLAPLLDLTHRLDYNGTKCVVAGPI